MNFIQDFSISEYAQRIYTDSTSVSFDEAYYNMNLLIQRKKPDLIINEINDSVDIIFADLIDTFSDSNEEDFKEKFQTSLNKLIIFINKFYAILKQFFLIQNNYNLRKQILSKFANILCLNPEVSDKIARFFADYTRPLPGSKEVLIEKESFKLLCNIFMGTSLWDAFISSLVNSTSAYCLYLSSTILQNEEIKNDPIQYLVICNEAIQHEKKFWNYLPKDNQKMLLNEMIKSLILNVQDEYLFEEKSKEILSKAFFDDLNNLDFFESLLSTIFDDQVVKNHLKELFFYHLMKKIVSFNFNENFNLTKSLSLVNLLIDIFEKIDIFSQTKFGIFVNLNNDETKHMIISQTSNLEISLAQFIGQHIDIIINNPTKKSESLGLIRQAALIVNYSLNKKEFIKMYNNLMFTRFCLLSGSNFELEKKIISAVESFLPPCEKITEQINDYGTSLTITNEWLKARSKDNRLNIFILESKIFQTRPKFKSLKLPNPLLKWQNEFESFFAKQNKSANINWIYRDNYTEIKLKINPNTEKTIKSPLFFAIVVDALCKNPNSTVEFLSAQTGLQDKDIDLILKKGLAKAMPLFKIIEKTKYRINEDFSLKQSSFKIVLPPRFSIVNEQKSIDVNQYRAKIVQKLRGNNPMPKANIIQSLKQEITSFNNNIFEEALKNLKQQSIIKEVSPGYFVCE